MQSDRSGHQIPITSTSVIIKKNQQPEMDLDWTQLLAIVAIVVIIYRWLTGNHDYFHHKPIPSMAVRPIMGSTGPLLLKQCTFPEFIQSSYKNFAGAR